MYDVDEAKGLGFLTGAGNWVGDQMYDYATGGDKSREILTQLMQGGQEFDMEDADGNIVTYSLGKDIYDAILNDDFEYVDNILRTVGADLAKSGKSWDDLDSKTMRDLGLSYNTNLARSNGGLYEDNVKAAQAGEQSPITLGDRAGSLNGLIFNENGKYNALAGNSHGANILDAADILATVATIPVGGGALAGTKIANTGAKVASTAAKAANAADKASDVGKTASKLANTADKLNGAGKVGSKITQNAGDVASGIAGRVSNFKQDRALKQLQRQFSNAEKAGAKASRAGSNAADAAADLSKLTPEMAVKMEKWGEPVSLVNCPKRNRLSIKRSWVLAREVSRLVSSAMRRTPESSCSTPGTSISVMPLPTSFSLQLKR